MGSKEKQVKEVLDFTRFLVFTCNMCKVLYGNHVEVSLKITETEF